MKTKTGIVTQIKKNRIIIITDTGEFIEVKKDKANPSIGSIYKSKPITNFNWQKIVTTAACLLFVLLISTEAYAYYIPTSTILLEGPLDIKIEVNKWDRIISIEGTNKESEELLEATNIKHNDIEEGLTKILETNKSLNTPEGNSKIIIALENNQSSDIEEKIKSIITNNIKNQNQMDNQSENNSKNNVPKDNTIIEDNTSIINNTLIKNNQNKNTNNEKQENNILDEIKTQNNETKKESKTQNIQDDTNDEDKNKKQSENTKTDKLNNDNSTNNTLNNSDTNTEKSNQSKKTPKIKNNKLK